MSLENAKANLKEFGKELGLEGLEFDENNTCILGIDDEFSLHITYEPNSKRLYLYSPLLDGLPSDIKLRLKLYEKLLEGSMLGGQMAGGGCGVAVQEELILMHCTIDMEYAVSSALRAFAPLYVETVEKWRRICRDVCEGREPEEGKAIPAGGAKPSPSAPTISKGPGPGSSGRGSAGPGGQGFIKI